ncbi:S8 family peptidase [Chitinophagaceae bacterium MMS25-I14]
MHYRFFIAAILTCTYSTVIAQTGWQLSSPRHNKRYGTATEEAYKLLQGKPSKTVTVAVIDIGTDINHEDLKDVIWTNQGEIPDNGIDDDHNGYVDDVHGWNFLGGAKEDMMYEATEETRMYQRLKKQVSAFDTTHLSAADSLVYSDYKTQRSKYLHDQQQRRQEANSMAMMAKMDRQWFWRQLFHIAGGRSIDQQIKDGAEQGAQSVIFNHIDADSMRRAVIGDNPTNASERFYGNNHVTGPEASHGTHTAGIIAARRNNHTGMDGVASDVRIMVLRAVPWGDERDKDIANAIRYAADNGASIINMSFGKYNSPDRNVVDSAIAYAVSKDVLLVHSAGNESKDLDANVCYPSRKNLDPQIAASWIEVGANSRKKGKKLVASFSNYGHNTVDIFAPGVNIYSCLPGNKYGKESGTSMAGPVVAGVAAIIRSYFPDLKASEVKTLLMNTAAHYPKNVRRPGTGKVSCKLDDLCISGGIVNAQNAVARMLKK